MAQPVNEQQELRARLAFSGLCFLAAFGAFQLFHSAILAATPAIDPLTLTPWLRGGALDHDGVELQVATLGTFGLLALLLAANRTRWAFARALRWPAQLAVAAALAWMLLDTSLSEFKAPRGTAAIAPALFALAVSGVLHWLAPRLSAARWTWSAWAVLVPALAALVTVRMGFYDVDWGYLIAPAQKLAQGERLGSFYAQYNWFSTGFVYLLLRANVGVHQMHLAMGLLFGAWFVLYALLAARMLRAPALVAGLMLSLLAVRCLAIREGPIFSPQVSVNRLDLWVPVLLALQAWGVLSRRSAAVVTFVYLGDSTFGLMFLALYLGFLGLEAFERRATIRAELPRLGVCAALPLAALLVHAALFGTITSPAGHHYAKLQLGFLPIADGSMVWPILAMFALAVPPLWARAGKARLADVFLVFAAAAQCVYFFGRSHEHNLLNISGAWLFVAFTLLARCTETTPMLGARLSIALSTFFLVLASTRALETFRLFDRVVREEGLVAYLTKPAPVDVVIDQQLKPLGWSGRMVGFDIYDGYLQHRLGVRHAGFFAPFYASALAEETAQALIDELSHGTRVISLGDNREALEDLSRSRALQARGLALSQHPIPGGFEITLQPRP